MPKMPHAALALLTMATLTGCGTAGPAADPCPVWLGRVAPIYLPAERQDEALERDVISLNEAGAAVGCW